MRTPRFELKIFKSEVRHSNHWAAKPFPPLNFAFLFSLGWLPGAGVLPFYGETCNILAIPMHARQCKEAWPTHLCWRRNGTWAGRQDFSRRRIWVFCTSKNSNYLDVLRNPSHPSPISILHVTKEWDTAKHGERHWREQEGQGGIDSQLVSQDGQFEFFAARKAQIGCLEKSCLPKSLLQHRWVGHASLHCRARMGIAKILRFPNYPKNEKLTRGWSVQSWW